MLSFNNYSQNSSFILKPKKDTNTQEYININNNNFNENNNILNIDLKTINFENIAVELALNVLQFKHNEYNEMTQQEIISYYNEKIKLNQNINFILALKIILKYKLKNTNTVLNKSNSSKINDSVFKNNELENNNFHNNFAIQNKISQKNVMSNSIKYNDISDSQNQINNFNITPKNINNNKTNNFKIIQVNTKDNNSKINIIKKKKY